MQSGCTSCWILIMGVLKVSIGGYGYDNNKNCMSSMRNIKI